jgi:predicted dehydrogenase
MQIRSFKFIVSILSILLFFSCTTKKNIGNKFTGAKHEVKLMTIDPGHFHAALVQKMQYDQVSPIVNVYAPEGADAKDHINRISGFNSRTENPTNWDEKVYTGPDFLEKMLKEKPGNVMVTSGNNKKKTEYIKAAVDAGINVLADKPMCINKAGFDLLMKTFDSAAENGILLYDVMTERSEITTILQKELIHIPEVFGEMIQGTPDDPAIVKASVHHFFKYVAGNPLKRPAWFFDSAQQGDGLVDVTTHLVDLVQWECFPEQILDYKTDVIIQEANHWLTELTREQFNNVTRLEKFPEYLKTKIVNDVLSVFCNGEINYTLKGIHAKVKVEWKYQAPEGAGDTHFSVIKGTKSNIIIKQGKEQNYRPELFVEANNNVDSKGLEKQLQTAIKNLQNSYAGIELKREKDHWQVLIPDKYRVGHEAHFGEVMERYLNYLVKGKLPDWEIPNMITKYYTTSQALEMANKKSD